MGEESKSNSFENQTYLTKGGMHKEHVPGKLSKEIQLKKLLIRRIDYD